MNSVHFTPGTGEHAAVITRVAEHEWHAVADGQAVGRGDASRRPDGRLYISIDAWHGPVFDRLAAAMLADLPTPLYTVVDEADRESTAGWERAGFTAQRRELGYLVPTDPRVTGLGSAQPPSGVTVVPAGEALEGPLRTLDRAIREEVEAAVGWHTMPAEVLPRPAGNTVVDPTKYAVAAQGDQYLALLRVAPVPRQPRIGLIAVRADHHRRGIARALLAQVLGALHRSGIETAWADVNEANGPAMALFEAVGAQRVSSNLELACR